MARRTEEPNETAFASAEAAPSAAAAVFPASEIGAHLTLGKRRENLIVFILAALQFVHMLDFVIMMPLSPQFMNYFSISPAQFGLLVSAYTLAAGTSSLIGALFVDRFDRKTLVLILFSGFIVGTLCCALAPTYELFLAARVISGAFGGLMTALVLSIIGDVFPPERRGTATGLVMMAFSIVTVIGVPLGLLLNDLSSWHLPFFAIAGLGLAILPLAFRILPVLKGHLETGPTSALDTLRAIFREPHHWTVFAFSTTTIMAAFLIIPYLAAYLVGNTGLSENHLKHVYGVGGLFTLFTARAIGRCADRYGKDRVFIAVAALSTIPILTMTHVGELAFPVMLVLSTLFFILVSGRMVPGLALITGSIVPRFRGSFMSVNSSIQQFAMGLASFGSGLILTKGPGQSLLHFNYVGYLSVISTMLCIYFA
ncbi:MAG: MFS transporter, partial [Leptospiraceae bacterium]|nr:MFS transporter [Leptospiraceae bacterium]